MRLLLVTYACVALHIGDARRNFNVALRQRKEANALRSAQPSSGHIGDLGKSLGHDMPSWPSERDVIKADRNDHPFCSMDPQRLEVLPEGHICPAECPYTVRLVAKKCSKVCVSDNRCHEFSPVLHFGDPVTHECVPTCGKDLQHRIPGCAMCASPGICSECGGGGFLLLPSYTLSKDGRECINNFHNVVLAMYAGIAVIVLLIAWYVALLLARRTYNTEQNQKNFQAAIKHREAVKPKNAEGKEFAWWSTWVCKDDICGEGVMQYFTWGIWMIVMAGVLLTGAYLSYENSKFVNNLEHLTEDIACYSGKSHATSALLQNVSITSALEIAPHRALLEQTLRGTHMEEAVGLLAEDPLAKYFDVDARMFKFLWPTYFVIFVLTVALAWWQIWYASLWELNHVGQHHYAVMVGGLPVTMTDPAKVHNHLKAHIPTLRGISLGYDCYDCAEDLDQLVLNWGHAEQIESDEGKYKKWQFAGIDDMMVEVGPRREIDAVKVLSELETSGRCIAVLESHKATLELARQGSIPGPDGTTLSVEKVHYEPVSVLWKNFSRHNFTYEIGKAFVVFLGVIFVWVLLYVPYAMDWIYYATIPGQSPSALDDLILGLLITVGNFLVATTVEAVIDWAGIRFKGDRDSTVLYVGFVSVFLNTAADLYLVTKVAQGISLDAAFEGERVGMDGALVEGLFALIIPGYLLLPYLCAPVCQTLLPFWLNKHVIRTRPVGKRESETAMEAPAFDIVWRYVDFVNNMTICLIMLMFTSPLAHEVMAMLMGSYVMIFLIDRYLLLRVMTFTPYASPKLAIAFSRLMVIPTGVLAGITAHWGVKAGVLPDLAVVYAVCVHVPAYFLVLEAGRLRRRFPANIEQGYQATLESLQKDGKLATYWNTNPAQCLRAKYLGEVTPGTTKAQLIPVEGGKNVLPTPPGSNRG